MLSAFFKGDVQISTGTNVYSQQAPTQNPIDYSCPSLQHNIVDSSPVGIIDIDSATNPKKVIPLKHKITKQIVVDYLRNFNEIAKKELAPDVIYNTNVILFDKGAILEITPKQAILSSECNEENLNFISSTANVNVVKALVTINVNLNEYFVADRYKEMMRLVEAKKPIFLDSNILFDDKRFIIIKEVTNQNWSREASEEDIHRIKKIVVHENPS